MRYKIQITSYEEQEIPTQSYQKISDTGNEKDNGAVYGYVKGTSKQEVERSVLEMELPELDIKKVVNALINQ